MPAVPENSKLLTGISVEESQDIESPESTSQVIISLLFYNWWFPQATPLLLDTFGSLLCCLLSCKNNLYWFDTMHCDIVQCFLSCFFQCKNTQWGKNVDTRSILARTSWSVILLLEWKLSCRRSDELNLVVLEYCRVVVVTLEIAI